MTLTPRGGVWRRRNHQPVDGPQRTSYLQNILDIEMLLFQVKYQVIDALIASFVGSSFCFLASDFQASAPKVAMVPPQAKPLLPF